MAIHTEKEFLETFKEGDEYWDIGSWHGKPVVVYGPTKIKELVLNHPEDPRKGLVRVIIESDGSYMRFRYVSDLVNQYHGVCKTREEADEYLKQRIAAFNADPLAQQEYRDREEWSKMMNEMDEMEWPDRLVE